MDRFSNELAAQFLAQKGFNKQKQVLLRVLGVRDLNDYSSLLKYLNQMIPVSEVNLVRVDGDDVLFSVQSGGGEEGLINAIANEPGHHLHSLEFSSALSQPHLAGLNYRWQSSRI